MTGGLDIAQLRADTSGCAGLTHFNQAGAGLPPRAVTEAMTRRIAHEAQEGPMESAPSAEGMKARARDLAAGLLGCSPAEVALLGSGAAAWGVPVAALPALRPGDRILVSQQEWGGNLATLQVMAARSGAVIEPMPVLEDGRTDLAALAARIDDRVRLICLTWLPCNSGLIDDAEGIGRIASTAGVPYVIDAAQAVGQIPIDVDRIGCDVLAATARKHLRGPRGTALLYIRGSFLPQLSPGWFDLGSAPWDNGTPRPRTDARVFETNEVSAVLVAGLEAALDLTTRLGVDAIRARVAVLADMLRDRLAQMPGVTLLDRGGVQSGLVTFALDGIPAPALRARLAEERIAIGVNGTAYTPIDMTARGLDEVARAAVSYLTTEAEIDTLCAALARCARA